MPCRGSPKLGSAGGQDVPHSYRVPAMMQSTPHTRYAWHTSAHSGAMGHRATWGHPRPHTHTAHHTHTATGGWEECSRRARTVRRAGTVRRITGQTPVNDPVKDPPGMHKSRGEVACWLRFFPPKQTVPQVQCELSGNSPDQGVGHVVQTMPACSGFTGWTYSVHYLRDLLLARALVRCGSLDGR